MNKEKILKILKNTVAVIVMLSLFVIIFYQNRDRDLFKFGKEESATVIDEYNEYSDSGNYTDGHISKVGENVAYLTTNSLRLLDSNAQGETLKVSLSDPMLHSEGEYLVCYGQNSFDAYVYKEEKECYSIKTDNKIIRAKVNKNGYLFAATEKEGYNCECVVYNRSGEPVFKWDISKSEFLDGDINRSNSAMAISVATAGERNLLGEILLIDITTAQIIKKSSFDSQLFFSLDFNKNDTFSAFGNKSLAYFNADGSEKWSYDFNNSLLLKCDITDPDRVVLAFSEAGSGIKGNSTDVKVINRLGKIVSEKNFDSVADDISVSDTSIAIAFGKNVYITDEKLEIKKSVQSDASIKKIELYNDDKHLFVIGNSGGKIIE